MPTGQAKGVRNKRSAPGARRRITNMQSEGSVQNLGRLAAAKGNCEAAFALIQDGRTHLVVSGSSIGWEVGPLVVPGRTACLRCLFQEPPEPGDVQTCEEAGIIGAATGVIGSVQAEEAIKILLGVGEPLSGRIFQHDGLRGETRTTAFPRDPDCPVCSSRSRITDLSRYAAQVSARGHVLA